MELRRNIHGRGASSNTPNRFSATEYFAEIQEWDAHEEKAPLKTEIFKDSSRSILSANDSPDIGFRYSLNPYRGCEHGCAYCYARPTHEYLGFSAGLDFESKIVVKESAPDLLRQKFSSKAWQPELIVMSGNTDCYQPLERQWQLTRRCLEVFLEYRNPIYMITKNFLITRDIDILGGLAELNLMGAIISVTTLDSELSAVLEPRASRPPARLKAIEILTKAKIPVMVNVAPVIPGLTDHEMPKILEAAAQAGARRACFVPLRLPLAVRPLFIEWLKVHRPERLDKVLNQVRDMKGGQLNNSQFGERMRGSGAFAENLRQLFDIHCRKFGLNEQEIELSTQHFKRPTTQLSLDL
jgi:DNA repair photolyase